jgi:hypothetical protein
MSTLITMFIGWIVGNIILIGILIFFVYLEDRRYKNDPTNQTGSN